jgi:predicted kinase/predicted metal-dependent HD superfamily phosphohydrolase
MLEEETSPLLPKTSEEIKNILQSQWEEKLLENKYHNFDHAVTIYNYASELVEKADITPREAELLKIAALYHDLGFENNLEDHESRGAEIAEEDLRSMQFDEGDIEIVKKLILGTKGEIIDGTFVYPKSNDKLVNLHRDADLGNVGHANLLDIVDGLRIELGVSHVEWRKIQTTFIKGHIFLTEEAEQLWGDQKKKNLETLESDSQPENLTGNKLVPGARQLILVAGNIGSGKSEVAKILATLLNAGEPISNDPVRQKMMQPGGVLHGLTKENKYSEENKKKVYEATFRAALEIARNGTAILDATFSSGNRRKRIMSMAEEEGIPVNIILVESPDEMAKEWLSRRSKDVSEAGFEDRIRIAQQFEPIETSHFVISNDGNINQLEEKLKSIVETVPV